MYVAIMLPDVGYQEPLADAHTELLIHECVGCGLAFERGERAPYVLACGANLCASCLPLLRARAVDKRTTICPEPRCHARTIFGAADDGDEGVKRMANAPLAAAIESGAFEQRMPLCVDHEDCGNDATKFCPKCDAHFCETCCHRLHTSSKSLRHHLSGILDLDLSAPAPKLPPTCPKHRIPLLLSCSSCDDILVCSQCFQFDGAHSGPEHVVEALEAVAGRRRAAVDEARAAGCETQERALATSRWAARTFNRLVGEGDARPPAEAEPGSVIDVAHQTVKAFFAAVHAATSAREVEMMQAVTAEGQHRRAELHERQAVALAVLARTQTALAVSARGLDDGDAEGYAGWLLALRAAASADVPPPDDALAGQLTLQFPEDLVARVQSAGSLVTAEDARKGARAAARGLSLACLFSVFENGLFCRLSGMFYFER